MNIRARKFVGAIVLLVFLALYATFAMAIGASRLIAEAKSLQGFYFLIAGLAWVIPAGLLIRWMQRPDPTQGE